MAVAEDAFWAFHGKPSPLDAAGRSRVAEQLLLCRRVSSLASAQRTQSVRTKYKASGYYKPTILFVDTNLDAADANRFLSITQALDRLATQPRAVQLLQQPDTTFERELYLYLPGDILFTIAGEIVDPAMARRARFELWWALKVTRPYEKASTGARYQVHGQWLDLTEQRCWKVLSPLIPYVLFGSLVIDPSTSLPFMLRPDELPATLRNAELVYQLPADLVDTLDAAVQAQLRQDEPTASESDDEGEENGDEAEAVQQPAAGVERDVREERREARARAKDAQRGARQTTLRECMRPS
jgi:hypothetical protein